MKKFRDAEGLFVAETPKLVSDLLPLLPCRRLFATEDFLRGLSPTGGENLAGSGAKVTPVTRAELERLSQQRQPHGALGVFEIPRRGESLRKLAALPEESLCLALDGVQDPGNLGTILRVADWFGVGDIFASHGTADAFAPKVVQASMGAIGRVRVHTVDLPGLLRLMADAGSAAPVYGTFLDGRDIYGEELSPNGLIVMGNEGNGVSRDVERLVTRRLLIPNYPAGRAGGESLNVAVATAIVCGEFRRRAVAGL